MRVSLTILLLAVSPVAAQVQPDQGQPPAQQPVLVSLSSPEDIKKAKVIVDPNDLSPDGSTSIDWFVPSIDGRLVAISLSENGSEMGTLNVFETATGRKLSDVVPRVQGPTAGGSAAGSVSSPASGQDGHSGRQRVRCFAGWTAPGVRGSR